MEELTEADLIQDFLLGMSLEMSFFFFFNPTIRRGDFQNLNCSSVLSTDWGTPVGICCHLFCSGGAGLCRGDAARDPWDTVVGGQGLVCWTHEGSAPKCGT